MSNTTNPTMYKLKNTLNNLAIYQGIRSLLIEYWQILCAISIILVLVTRCSSANLDDVKEHACDRWKEVGFSCLGYEGYQLGIWWYGPYGGANVWHTLAIEKHPDQVFSGYIQKWGDEYHIYNLKCINCVR